MSDNMRLTTITDSSVNNLYEAFDLGYDQGRDAEAKQHQLTIAAHSRILAQLRDQIENLQRLNDNQRAIIAATL